MQLEFVIQCCIYYYPRNCFTLPTNCDATSCRHLSPHVTVCRAFTPKRNPDHCIFLYFRSMCLIQRLAWFVERWQGKAKTINSGQGIQCVTTIGTLCESITSKLLLPDLLALDDVSDRNRSKGEQNEWEGAKPYVRVHSLSFKRGVWECAPQGKPCMSWLRVPHNHPLFFSMRDNYLFIINSRYRLAV